MDCFSWMTRFQVLIFGAALVLVPGLAVAQPNPTYPAVAVLSDPTFIPLRLTGTGFGSAGTLEVAGGPDPLSIDSSTVCSDTVTHSCILFWSDSGIAAKLPVGFTEARARVVTTPTSEFFRVQYYAYDWFDINKDESSSGAGPYPLAVAVDASHRVWVNEEYHRDFKMVNPAIGRAAKFGIGHPATGIFSSVIFPGHPVKMSQNGEDILVDPLGRVWFTESGEDPQNGPTPNHARVVMYDPSAGQSRYYNLPGNANGTFGLAYEQNYQPGRDRIWYTDAVRGKGSEVIWQSRLAWFDVELAPYNTDGMTGFDLEGGCGDRSCPDGSGRPCGADQDCPALCVSGLCGDGTTSCATGADCARCNVSALRCKDGTNRLCADDSNCQSICGSGTCQNQTARACFVDEDCAFSSQVCSGNDASLACFHQFDLPGVVQVAHLILPGDGTVWFTPYWGNALGHLDPSTGDVQLFPLPPPRWSVPPLNIGFSQPWEIKKASNGDIVFSEFADSTISRFDISRLYPPNDPADCQTVVGDRNPCIGELNVPGVVPPSHGLHSIAFDRHGNLWFTQALQGADPAATTSVGYVKRDWSTMVLLPPLSVYPFFRDGTFVSFHGAGIAVDQVTHDTWFADFNRQRIGRLRPIRTNLAVGQSATQSWTLCFGEECIEADRAVDGNIDGNFANQSVTFTTNPLTNPPPNPAEIWWEVDLGAVWSIAEIELWNRTDYCPECLSDFYVFVSDIAFESTNLDATKNQSGVTGRYQQDAVDRSIAFDINRTARYVRVQLQPRDVNPWLYLAEVVVLGGAVPECSGVAQCDDQSACTSDSCVYGRCQHTCRWNQPCVDGCDATCQNVAGSCVCTP